MNIIPFVMTVKDIQLYELLERRMILNIRIAGTEFSLKNKSFEIYVQGCYRKCAGCHNPDTQLFNGGKLVEMHQYLAEQYYKIEPFIDCGLIKNIYVSGGDLLCQEEEIARDFSSLISFWFHPPLLTWLFTGAGEDEPLPEWVWDDYDIVKCGRYREDLRNPEGTFPASSNQKLMFNKYLDKDIVDSINFKGEKIWR